ncbi:MAG: hypothetical protein ACYC96_08320 [Fimbriimonadaceae bacterium]
MMRTSLLVLAVASAQGNHSAWTLTADAAGYAYASPDVGRISLDGVCSMTPSSATCWRPDGVPDATITKHVEEHFATPDSQPMGLAYRRRNLLLLWHGPFVGATLASLRGAGGGRPATVLQQAWMVRGAKGFEFADWLPARADQTSVDVRLYVSVSLPPVRASVRGGKLRIGEYTVRYGRLEKAKANIASNFGSSFGGSGGPWWSQDYRIEPDPMRTGFSFTTLFLGNDGKPLASRFWIETPRKGEPVRHWEQASSSSSGPGASGYWAFGGDARRVAAIELHPVYTRQVDFHSVALTSR